MKQEVWYAVRLLIVQICFAAGWSNLKRNTIWNVFPLLCEFLASFKLYDLFLIHWVRCCTTLDDVACVWMWEFPIRQPLRWRVGATPLSLLCQWGTVGGRPEPGRSDDGKPQAKKKQWSGSHTPTEGSAAFFVENPSHCSWTSFKHQPITK